MFGLGYGEDYKSHKALEYFLTKENYSSQKALKWPQELHTPTKGFYQILRVKSYRVTPNFDQNVIRKGMVS